MNMQTPLLDAPNQNLNLVIPTPVMSHEAFAQATGVTADTVRGWMDQGHLPTIKIGRRRMVNFALYTQLCLGQEG